MNVLRAVTSYVIYLVEIRSNIMKFNNSSMIRLIFVVIGISLFWRYSFFGNFLYAEIPEDEFTSYITEFSREINPNTRIKLLERLLPNASKYQRFIMLSKIAKTSIEIGQYGKAKEYAKELLSLANEFQCDWNYGNAIHDGNMVLGMVSLNSNLVEEAKNFLLKAGNAPTSPQLKTFGPSMILADALLDKGETKAVIDYLELIKKIWGHDNGRLDSWIAAIKGGGRPYFGENLLY
jgi:hypothetical protein